MIISDDNLTYSLFLINFLEKNKVWTWEKWADIMKSNFERFFYVTNNDSSQYVNRRGIIKDTYGSTQGYTDYQLRPNFTITLAVVSLFDDIIGILINLSQNFQISKPKIF